MALAEARQAAASASADRETFQSKWRAEWEAAKDEHAAELRGGRARMAMLEADLAELRETLRTERREWCGRRRRELETRLCEALAQARRFREDQKGAAESLRIMVEHESTLRTAARHQTEVVARLRGDAATSAVRCENVASHCAELLKERDAATRRAEGGKRARRAREEAGEAWGNPAAALSRAVAGDLDGGSDVGRVPALLAAAVRGLIAVRTRSN